MSDPAAPRHPLSDLRQAAPAAVPAVLLQALRRCRSQPLVQGRLCRAGDRDRRRGWRQGRGCARAEIAPEPVARRQRTPPKLRATDAVRAPTAQGGYDARPPALRRAFVRIDAGAHASARMSRGRRRSLAQPLRPTRSCRFAPGGGTDTIAAHHQQPAVGSLGPADGGREHAAAAAPTSAPTRSRKPIPTATRCCCSSVPLAGEQPLPLSRRCTYDPVADFAPVSR